MMRLLFSLSLLLFLIGCHSSSEEERREKIRNAVERQMRDFPHSTLQDIYKSFFQDRFGPGHMVADTSRAAAYLREELSKTCTHAAMLYEPTGCDGNYYRVSLSVVADGRVPFDVYLNAFLSSVREVGSNEVKEWAAEWQWIEKVISDMEAVIPNSEADALAIRELLQQGFYAVHHSKAYNEHYAPHYRIIEKSIFEKEILPLLD